MALDNFVLQNTNPLEAYLQGAGGIQTLQNNQQIMDARVAAQQLAQQQAQAAQDAAQAKQQMQVAMYNETNPLKRANLIAQYTTANPDDFKAVELATKGMSEAQRSSIQGLVSQITSAADNDRPDLGLQKIDEYIAASEGNVPDDQMAALKANRKMYADDPKAAVIGLGAFSRTLDPPSYDANNKVVADTAAVVGEEGRKVAMHPLEVAAKRATTEKIREETRSELQKRGLTSAQIAKTQVEAEAQLQALGLEGGGKAPTEGQAKANIFGTRAQKAAANLEKLEVDPSNVPHIPDMLIGTANAVGGLSKNQQSYIQYKRDFINSVLRRESGAAIGQDEFDNADLQYFPKLGDAPETIAQKAANRKEAASLILSEAGSFAGKGATPSGAKTATKASLIASAKAHGVDPLVAMKNWKDQGNIIQ